MRNTGMNCTLKLENYQVCYNDLGTGDSTLIFIHGFPFDKSSWNFQLEFLKSEHRVIAYDLRGYGASTVGDEQISIPVFADDLINFMDNLGIDQAIVCGLSMGGYILLNALSKHASRFKGIVLADTQCNEDTPETRIKRQESIKQIEQKGLEEYSNSLINNLFYEQTLQMKYGLVEQIKETILSTSPKVITDTISALAKREDTCNYLNQIEIPSLIMCGRYDKLTPVERSEFLHSNIRNSKLHIIDNAAHLSNIEQADEFNKQLKYFVSELN